MSDSQKIYILWGALLAAICLHLVWCFYVAYPAAFERQFKKGKSWVYIPLRWKGFHKFLAVLISRIFALTMAVSGAEVLAHYTGKNEVLWVVGFSIALLYLGLKLQSFWLYRRYRQQEDAYYRLHDALRLEMIQSGKDFTEAQFRSLATYQHQQRLRKADETGKLLALLRGGRSRQAAVAQGVAEA